MKRIPVVLLALLICGQLALAQTYPLRPEYIAAGNSEALSAWFADNLEIAVLARESDASRAQARQIVKTFFDTYTPRSFDVTHTAGRANMKYALGTLKAGGESFVVTIFMSCKDSSYKIQQLKIERL